MAIPTVSIVVPIYKVEQYLRQCIDSILCQTHQGFDLILVDDGSPDNSGDICENYARTDSRITVIHQKNGGLSAARNTGIDWSLAHSPSRYITFIDSDDFIAPTYLEDLYDGVSTGAQVSCVRYTCFSDSGSFTFGILAKKWRRETPENYWLKTSALPQSAWGKLYSKSLFQHVRYPVGRLHEDEFTTHKILFSVGEIATCNKHPYYYRLRKTGITGSTWSPQRMDSLDAYVEQCDYFKEHGFMRAYELARGRKLNQMIQAAKNLAYFNIDHNKAKALLAQVVEENKKSRVPFWENRDLYHVLEPRFYKIKWTIAMIGNALTHGFSSWIVQDGIGTVRQALYPPTK